MFSIDEEREVWEKIDGWLGVAGRITGTLLISKESPDSTAFVFV
jgi:hypothetical protein